MAYAKLPWALFLFVVFVVSSCSTSRLVPENEHLLKSVTIKSDDKSFDVSKLEPYIRQKANSKWFSLFKIPLGIYGLSGKDTTKWVNRTLQRIGEKPVLFDTLQTRLSCEDLVAAMRNMGYMKASVSFSADVNGKDVHAIYYLHPGNAYLIGHVGYDIQDTAIARILKAEGLGKSLLTPGSRFSVDALEAERNRITDILLDKGYYRFNKDFIVFNADSSALDENINLTLRLLKYRADNKSKPVSHPRYFIDKVNFTGTDSTGVHLRRRVLENNTAIAAGEPFSSSSLKKTYSNFAKLQAVKFTNIRFVEHPDTSLLDCDIQVSTNKPNRFSFQPEGTNTAGDLGAAATFTYENRNLFRGSELLSLQFRAAFEAITGLEGYQNQNYEEYGVEAKLMFPRFIAPFLSRSFIRRSNAKSEILFSYNLQNRPEFHRRVVSAAWRYHWNEPAHKTSYRLDLIDLNYVYMPWISSTFKKDYLDNTSNRNAILRYNYEDLFIMRMGLGLSYNNGKDAFKANVETAGNLLALLSNSTGMGKNAEGQHTLFNIAYAQYAKADIDYTRLVVFDKRNSLALHFDFGIAYPYGNSTILPFEKRYFSGGANSVRGWNVRELGPGKFKGKDGRIDFINQTGDMKLDLNLEYRTSLFWKFDGAFFLDAGNIWTLRSYEDQPGGQFKFDEFYKQIAASYGLGIRLNLDYFIVRFDFGMKAVNPVYDSAKEHYPLVNPVFSRDLTFHFAVGMPF